MTRRSIALALAIISMGAALALVAQSEWQLALAVGWPPGIAWAAPLALDVYVLAAVVARRDMGVAVIVSTLSVLASHSVYAMPGAWQDATPGTGHLLWQLAAGCSVVPLLVSWRVHHLLAPEAAPEVTPVEEAAPVAVLAPVAEQGPAPDRHAVAAAIRALMEQGKPYPTTAAEIARTFRISHTSARRIMPDLGLA